MENDLNEKYDVKIPDTKNPRLKIVGLDEKPEDNSEIIETLKKQNDEFFDNSSEIKVVTVFEMKNMRQKIYYNLIVEVNPKLYNNIMSCEEPKVNFNWNRCKVFDALHVKRCLKCCSLDGHTTKECKNNVVCHKCSGSHKSQDCDKDKLNCINCQNYMKKLKLNLNTEHSVMSKECEVYQRILKSKMRSINYNE